MFDVTKFDSQTLSETGVPMEVKHPRTGSAILDDAGKPVTITLIGPNSDVSRAVFRSIQQRRAEFASKGVKMSDADFDRERFDALVKLTTGWTFDSMGAEPFPFSADNARKFWADKRWEWLSVQAFSFCQQDGNYLPS